mgnify:CR=1 FL=1
MKDAKVHQFRAYQLVMVEKNEDSIVVIYVVDDHLDGLQYSGRLTRAKTKALASHGKNAYIVMLKILVVQSYTMVMNGGMMVEGKSTLSLSIKKDTYAKVVARKS